MTIQRWHQCWYRSDTSVDTEVALVFVSTEVAPVLVQKWYSCWYRSDTSGASLKYPCPSSGLPDTTLGTLWSEQKCENVSSSSCVCVLCPLTLF